MVTQELLEYIRGELGHGMSREQIEKTLVSHGWAATDVVEGFQALTRPSETPTRAPVEQKPYIQQTAETIVQKIVSVQPQPIERIQAVQAPKIVVEPVIQKPTAPASIRPLVTSLNYRPENGAASPLQPAPVQKPMMEPRPQVTQPVMQKPVFAQQPQQPVAPIQSPKPMAARIEEWNAKPVAPVSPPVRQPEPVIREMAAAPVASSPEPKIYEKPMQPTPSFSATPTPAPISAMNPNEPLIRPSQMMAEAPKKRHAWKVVVVVLLLLVLGGGAYAYAAGYFVQLETLPMKSFEAAQEKKSATFDVTLSVDMPQTGSTSSNPEAALGAALFPSKVSVTLKGAYDVTTPKDPLFKMNLSLDAGTIAAAGDILAKDKIMYGRLTKLPDLSLIGGGLSDYKDKWYSFPLDGDTSFLTDLPTQTFAGFNPDELDNLTQDQKDELERITANAHFIKIVKRMTPEVIGGALSYHFTFDLDREGVKNYLADLKDYVQKVGKDSSALSAFDPTFYNQEIDNIKNFSGEAWIGERDRLPHKMVISFTVGNGGSSSEMKFTLSGIFSGWDEPITVDVPSDSIPFKNPLVEAQGKAKDASTMASLSSLRAEAEIYYDSHGLKYSGLCSSPTVKNSFEVMTRNYPDNPVPTCTARTQSYIMSTEITPGDDGTKNYFCIDSYGFAGKALPPSGNYCKAIN